MPRLTIYIPDDLHRQMRELGGGMNLSTIAQDAIRKALAAASPQQGRTAMEAHLLDVPTRGDYRLFQVPLPGNVRRVKVTGTALATSLTHTMAEVVVEFAKRQLRHGAEVVDGDVLKNALDSAEAEALDAYLTGRARGLSYSCAVRVSGHSVVSRTATEVFHAVLTCIPNAPGPDSLYGIDVILPMLPGRAKWQQLAPEDRRRCIESAAREHIQRRGLPLAWGYENGKHTIRLTQHPTNPVDGDPGEPFTMSE